MVKLIKVSPHRGPPRGQAVIDESRRSCSRVSVHTGTPASTMVPFPPYPDISARASVSPPRGRGKAPGMLRRAGPELPHSEVDNGDNDCWQGGWLRHRGPQHSWNCHRTVPAVSRDAQLLAHGSSWSQCPGPSPGHGGCWPGGDTDPCREVTTQSSQQLPVTASPGTAPRAPHTPSLHSWGAKGGVQPPPQTGETKGTRDQLQPGNVPCPGPHSQGSGYPVPRQPEPGMAFQAQAFLHPAGLGARGRGPLRGPLPAPGAGRWLVSGRGEGQEDEASLGGGCRMHPQSITESWGGGNTHTLTAGPRPHGGGIARVPRVRGMPSRADEAASCCQHIPACRVQQECTPNPDPPPWMAPGLGNPKTEQPWGWGRSPALPPRLQPLQVSLAPCPLQQLHATLPCTGTSPVPWELPRYPFAPSTHHPEPARPHKVQDPHRCFGRPKPSATHQGCVTRAEHRCHPTPPQHNPRGSDRPSLAQSHHH